MMQIPKYKTLAGLSFPPAEIVPGHTQFTVQNTTEEEVIAYAEMLSEEGFSLYDKKVKPAGSEKPYNRNLFYTYINEEQNIFIFWAAGIRTVHIVTSPCLPLPKTEKIPSPSKMHPKLFQLKLALGSIYAVHLADNHFVLMDGSLDGEGDPEALYAFLKEKSGEETPRIAMWMFTHPDSDHIRLATVFLKAFAGKVDIEGFAYQFNDCEKAKFVYIDSAIIGEEIQAFEESIKTNFPHVPVYTLHAGQSYFFPGVEIEILLTADTIYPYPYASANDVSAAWRLKTAEKTFLFLGDCMQYSCRELASIYGDYVKSDILQLAHHGLIGGEIGLYKLVDPMVCLWYTSENRFLGKVPNQKYQWCLGEGGCDYNRWIRDESVRKREHYHLGKTTEIDLGPGM